MSKRFWDKCVHVTGDVDAWITLRWRLCAASSTAGTMSSAGSPSPSARPGGYQDRTRTPAGEQEVTGVVRTCREQTGSTGFYRVWTRSPTRVRQQTWDQFQLVSLSGDTRIRCWLLRYQLLADTSPQDWKNRWFNAFIHGRLCHCWMTVYITVVQLLLRHGVTEKKVCVKRQIN